jgi:heme oxygenase
LNSVHCDISGFSASVRYLLRSATAKDHADVDSRFGSLIGRGAAGYLEFLLLSATAVGPIEEALREAHVERILPDWEDRSRAASLRADLAEMGVVTPMVARPPSLGGEAHQFGVVYVLEGSRLGARVLVRRLLASPDLHTPYATRYLRHGEGLPLWQTFVGRLESSASVGMMKPRLLSGVSRPTIERIGAPDDWSDRQPERNGPGHQWTNCRLRLNAPTSLKVSFKSGAFSNSSARFTQLRARSSSAICSSPPMLLFAMSMQIDALWRQSLESIGTSHLLQTIIISLRVPFRQVRDSSDKLMFGGLRFYRVRQSARGMCFWVPLFVDKLGNAATTDRACGRIDPIMDMMPRVQK